MKLLNSSKLVDIIQATKNFYPKLANWTKINIRNRAFDLRKCAKDESFLPEILALIWKASKLELELEPRDTQLFTLLLFLFQDENKGRLIEIPTGEGKSLTIAMLAIIRALQGEKVDVVTSQAELARRDATTFKDLFQYFNFNVSDNGEQHYTSGPKACYAKEIQIIYGYINNFQFDLLREEFSGLNTRGGRGFDRVIVDEVDNLLIDEGAKIAMLASIMPGMENLKSLLLLIALELELLEQRFFIVDNTLYFREIVKENQKPVILKIEDKHKFLKAKMIQTVDELLKDKLFMPEYLKGLIKIQIEKWIENASLAQLYQLKQQYKIKKDRYQILSVVPVDYANTGSIQNGTTWGDGLHQFLQIKHGLENTVETLVVNFLSNMAFIKRYQHINGVTGTIGSEEAQKLLADPDNYNIDFAYIPSYKASQFKELNACISKNSATWLGEIEASVIREATNGRVVLIIAETIEDAEAIQTRLKKYHQTNIKIFTEDDEQYTNYLTGDIEGNTIINSTNIFGRGADVKLAPSVIQAGGLHVCLSYLPSNIRVEKQAFGRAARAGAPGTAQLILNRLNVAEKLEIQEESLFIQFESWGLDKIRERRDYIEKKET